MVNKCQIELQKESVNTLRKVCTLNNIRGCASKKTKEELIKHICNNGVPYKPERLPSYLSPLNVLLNQLYYDQKPIGYNGIYSFIITDDIEQKDRMFKIALDEKYIEPIFVKGEKRFKITQKGIETQLPKLKMFMTKPLRENVLRSFKELAKSPNEYSIALDFERNQESPERIIEFRGGEDETLKINDFELYGHSHPGHHIAYPSVADMYNMEPFVPTFIIASQTGDINFFVIENYKKWTRWRKEHPIEKNQHASSIDPNWKLIFPEKGKDFFTPDNITNTNEGRKFFFKETGVRILPFKNFVRLTMIRDDIQEKPYFSIPKSYLKKWHQKSA